MRLLELAAPGAYQVSPVPAMAFGGGHEQPVAEHGQNLLQLRFDWYFAGAVGLELEAEVVLVLQDDLLMIRRPLIGLHVGAFKVKHLIDPQPCVRAEHEHAVNDGTGESSLVEQELFGAEGDGGPCPDAGHAGYSRRAGAFIYPAAFHAPVQKRPNGAQVRGDRGGRDGGVPILAVHQEVVRREGTEERARTYPRREAVQCFPIPGASSWRQAMLMLQESGNSFSEGEGLAFRD